MTAIRTARRQALPNHRVHLALPGKPIRELAPKPVGHHGAADRIGRGSREATRIVPADPPVTGSASEPTTLPVNSVRQAEPASSNTALGTKRPTIESRGHEALAAPGEHELGFPVELGARGVGASAKADLEERPREIVLEAAVQDDSHGGRYHRASAVRQSADAELGESGLEVLAAILRARGTGARAPREGRGVSLDI